MREVLVVSVDNDLVERFKLRLEGAGFLVSTSDSLEKSFLEAGKTEPFLVIVDGESVPEQIWQARNFLRWLHHRSPVVLLSDDLCEDLRGDCDDCLPRLVGMEELLSCIRSLSVH